MPPSSRLPSASRLWDRLDGVSENAGVIQDNWVLADKGNEIANMVNFLGTMLLAGLVAPKLQQTAARLGRPTHLSIVGSGMAFQDDCDAELKKAVASGQDIIEYFNKEKNFSTSRFVIYLPHSSLTSG